MHPLLFASLAFFLVVVPGRATGSANPILPGYYADPSIVSHEGRYYLYATLDPWGGNTLGCWESTDYKTSRSSPPRTARPGIRFPTTPASQQPARPS